MPSNPSPPPHPWIPRPESAFRPVNAWIPFDEGNVRDFVGGRPATRSGSTSLGRGDWGPCLAYSGGSALTGNLAGTFTALSITSFHRASSAGNGAIIGIGTSGQIGLLYYNGQYGINSFSGVLNNAITLAPPTERGCAITTTIAGFSVGAAVAHWVNGALVYSSDLTLNITNPGGNSIRLGASGNNSWPWPGQIGPTYIHSRVLSGSEIRKLHADPWRLFRDQRDDVARRIAMFPPPFRFSGNGESAALSGDGRFGLAWGFAGGGVSAELVGMGAFGFAFGFAGTGISGAPIGAGEFFSGWGFRGHGFSPAVAGDGVFTWPWEWAGDGSVIPEGSGEFTWVPPFIPTHLRSNARLVGPSARNAVVRRK